MLAVPVKDQHKGIIGNEFLMLPLRFNNIWECQGMFLVSMFETLSHWLMDKWNGKYLIRIVFLQSSLIDPKPECTTYNLIQSMYACIYIYIPQWKLLPPTITDESPSSSFTSLIFRTRALLAHMSSPAWNKKDILAEGRRKKGTRALYLHMPVILIYTGCQPTRSEFAIVARATDLLPPSLAR